MADYDMNLADKILIDYSNELTRILLEGFKMDIDRMCRFVKDYQRKYLLIKEAGATEKQLKAFTPLKWWEMSKIDTRFKLIILRCEDE